MHARMRSPSNQTNTSLHRMIRRSLKRTTKLVLSLNDERSDRVGNIFHACQTQLEIPKTQNPEISYNNASKLVFELVSYSASKILQIKPTIVVDVDHVLYRPQLKTILTNSITLPNSFLPAINRNKKTIDA